MSKIKAVNGAGKAFYANHLAANDYYSEHERIEGVWMGELSVDFKLSGATVETETFSLFQRNINPETGAKLTQRTVMTGVRFFDFQCAAPKSVSILALFDGRLALAHDEAVREAMDELEKLAAVRIRKGDNVRTNNLENTGKIVYACFRHDASRALDPQLHTHNVVVNVTQDSEGKYKALESLEMCRAIRYAGKVYHNALSKKCRTLGYEMVNRLDEKGNITWQDIAGVPKELMERFSKRRLQIEAEEEKFIAEHGRKPTLTENNYLSVSTRSVKMKHSSRGAVLAHQLQEMGMKDETALRQLVRRASGRGETSKEVGISEAKEMLQEALPLVFERESVVKLDKVLAETLNRNLGRVSLQILKEAAEEIDELRNLGGLEVNPWVSPEKVIERELFAIKSVEDQRDLFESIAPDFVAFPGEESRTKQAELIHGMLSSKDRFNLFRGVAGAGKTSTLQELCRGLRSGGIKSIYVIAPTNSATDVLKQEGFEESQTVAHFLVSPKKPPRGSYVIIDESGLNSLREGVEIIRTARANDYRVLFVGDARQHTAVESGDFFRLLEDHSEIQRFSLTDIYRQQNEEYRRGISECALGNFEAAFERFDKNGFIHESKSKYLEAAAQSYMDYTDGGRNIDQAILVAPTHDEGDKLTDAVRAKLKESGSVAQNGRSVEVFRSWSKPKAWIQNPANYTRGTTIGFIRNMKGIAQAGEVARVEFVRGNYLHLDNGVRVYVKSAADFIEVGEMREIELCKGDLIQFNVNLRDRKIYNGNIAMITDVPGEVMMLHSDGKPRELVKLSVEYSTFKYGWVTTSHKSQGRTAGNVVVAAQAMDRKAFYVALSRGRKHMALHCPEKEFLKQQLNFRIGDRLSVHDLLKDGQILSLSQDARERKAETLPNTTYKSIAERARKLALYLKNLAKRVWEQARVTASRRARHAKYGYGRFTEKMLFEVEREHAVEFIQAPKPETPDKKSRFVDPNMEWLESISSPAVEPSSEPPKRETELQEWLEDISSPSNEPVETKPKPEQPKMWKPFVDPNMEWLESISSPAVEPSSEPPTRKIESKDWLDGISSPSIEPVEAKPKVDTDNWLDSLATDAPEQPKTRKPFVDPNVEWLNQIGAEHEAEQAAAREKTEREAKEAADRAEAKRQALERAETERQRAEARRAEIRQERERRQAEKRNRAQEQESKKKPNRGMDI